MGPSRLPRQRRPRPDGTRPMTAADLIVTNLHVSVEGKEILKGLSLELSKGETHALMGPNGSGKSTFANTLMGHPKYEVTSADILFKGESVLGKETSERAPMGLFTALEYPSFPRARINARIAPSAGENGKVPHKRGIPPKEFRELMRSKMAMLKMDDTFVTRYLNDGFSGGEKKRAEILQMAMLKPEIAIMDETDSGLDIDALKVVADGVNALSGPDMGVLVITHYNRILDYIKPDRVHVMIDGRIATSGGPELALELESRGYDWVREEVSSR